MTRVQIVGGGKMGAALAGGLIGSGWARPADVRIVEAVAGRRDELSASWPEVQVTDTVGGAEGSVIAVKPADVPAAVRSTVAAGGGRILSIAAGVTLASLEEAAGAGVPVVRAMPNTPSLVGAGASAIAGGSSTDATDLDWAEELLGAVGVVVRVAERQLDAVTGLSGSGPAYVFLVAEAMIDAGVAAGLPRDLAEVLANQTLAGAGQMLLAGSSAAELRAGVTSPGGTTAAGLRVLEQRAVRAAFIDAVAAAAERSSELA